MELPFEFTQHLSLHIPLGSQCRLVLVFLIFIKQTNKLGSGIGYPALSHNKPMFDLLTTFNPTIPLNHSNRSSISSTPRLLP